MYTVYTIYSIYSLYCNRINHESTIPRGTMSHTKQPRLCQNCEESGHNDQPQNRMITDP